MSIYNFLDKKKKKRINFEKSEEFSFFMKNRNILLEIPKFSFLFNSERNDFNIIRANIVIHSYLNKIYLEQEIFALNENKGQSSQINFSEIIIHKILQRPYFLFNDIKVYIPFFNIHLNKIYILECEKILEYPYLNLLNDFSNSTIDFFDLYGAKIYDSNFTKLVNVGTNGNEIAFFHHDTNTIYIINNQGRLDHKIVLFDKYIKQLNLNNLLERVKPVVDAYFDNSRSKFVYELHNNQFISDKIYNMVRRKDFSNEK